MEHIQPRRASFEWQRVNRVAVWDRRLVPFFLFLTIAAPCFAMPTLMVGRGAKRCVSVEAAMDTMLRVDYEAPDIIMQGHDTATNPSYLEINVVSLNRISSPDLHEAPVREHLKPTKEVLTSSNGTVSHHMEINGLANVCFHAPRKNLQKKKNHNPNELGFFRYGVRIHTSEEVVPRSLSKERIDDHLTSMEEELIRLQGLMTNILHEANFAKDNDMALHRQFLAMHNTTFYWPIVQLFVLLFTGFTQVRHIVEFFKKRRII